MQLSFALTLLATLSSVGCSTSSISSRKPSKIPFRFPTTSSRASAGEAFVDYSDPDDPDPSVDAPPEIDPSEIRDDSTMLLTTSRHPSSQSSPFVHTVTLLAQEERIPPFGQSADPNRPVGFATVFLSLRNPIDDKQTLTLQSIKVVNAESGQVELAQEQPKPITLMPLEHATIEVHLTNQTGYAESGAVKAIATYTLPSERRNNPPLIHVAESAAVELWR